jgi:hypothetical protein
VLHAELRALDRHYRPRIAQVKGEDRDALSTAWTFDRAEVLDELEEHRTQRLLRQAWRYYIVAPEKPWDNPDQEDEHWKRGYVGETWHLKPAGIAALRRQIEDAKSRRREVWATWAKILGGLVAGLVALVSALVSLILVSKR